MVNMPICYCHGIYLNWKNSTNYITKRKIKMETVKRDLTCHRHHPARLSKSYLEKTSPLLKQDSEAAKYNLRKAMSAIHKTDCFVAKNSDGSDNLSYELIELIVSAAIGLDYTESEFIEATELFFINHKYHTFMPAQFFTYHKRELLYPEEYYNHLSETNPRTWLDVEGYDLQNGLKGFKQHSRIDGKRYKLPVIYDQDQGINCFLNRKGNEK